VVDLAGIAGIPTYVWIREALRKDIAGGIFKHGERLPAEHELAARFGVSRMTLRKSLEDLVDEGLLYRRHGRGTFVAFLHLERDHTRLTNFFDSASQEGIPVRASLLVREIISAHQKVAAALNLSEGERVIRIKTLRYANELPITVHDAHIPHDLFPSLSEGIPEAQHLWTSFERCGYKVKRAIQRIEALPATDELARLMEINPGAPILFKERTLYADDGTPIEFTYCYNRGDLYSLTVSLER
jgi:GntR family transcriptional regulator